MSFQMKKVTELVKETKKDKITFSYEVTPDITEDELNKISGDPLFYAVTWHPKNHNLENLQIPPIKIAEFLRNKEKHVLLHLSCESMTKKYLLMLLNHLKKEGIRNFLCLLGDNFNPDKSDFKSTNELILFIRELTGDYFCIGVAGFPEGDDAAMKRLKDKVDGGADFIVTQAFFEASVFGEFLSKCKRFNINAPVLPGIFLFDTEEELTGFVNKVKCKVSDKFLEFASSKLDQNFTGTDIVSKLIRDINNQNANVDHFHLFTLNKILNVVKLIDKIEK